jgi:hypothetical protein
MFDLWMENDFLHILTSKLEYMFLAYSIANHYLPYVEVVVFCLACFWSAWSQTNPPPSAEAEFWP